MKSGHGHTRNGEDADNAAPSKHDDDRGILQHASEALLGLGVSGMCVSSVDGGGKATEAGPGRQSDGRCSSTLHATAEATGTTTASDRGDLSTTAQDSRTQSPDEATHSTVLWRVPHLQQKYTWDCGHACARMIVRAVTGQDISYADVMDVGKQYGVGSSETLWTIDLCYILKHYGVRHRFYTESTGVESTLKSKDFYAKTFEADCVRVTGLFERAEAAGLIVENRAVTTDELLSHIRGGGIAVVLVDSSKMKPPRWFPSLLLQGPNEDEYHGHYVIVSGANELGTSLFLVDPSKKDPVSPVSMDCFNVARSAHGTDSDMILIDQGVQLRQHVSVTRHGMV
eukprot:m.179934 g.179934  ORF g.179934 m.179934 type:complete len:341 (-) comp14886_c0_seq1:220-1242(-)